MVIVYHQLFSECHACESWHVFCFCAWTTVDSCDNTVDSKDGFSIADMRRKPQPTTEPFYTKYYIGLTITVFASSLPAGRRCCSLPLYNCLHFFLLLHPWPRHLPLHRPPPLPPLRPPRAFIINNNKSTIDHWSLLRLDTAVPSYLLFWFVVRKSSLLMESSEMLGRSSSLALTTAWAGCCGLLRETGKGKDIGKSLVMIPFLEAEEEAWGTGVESVATGRTDDWLAFVTTRKKKMMVMIRLTTMMW